MGKEMKVRLTRQWSDWDTGDIVTLPRDKALRVIAKGFGKEFTPAQAKKAAKEAEEDAKAEAVAKERDPQAEAEAKEAAAKAAGKGPMAETADARPRTAGGKGGA